MVNMQPTEREVTKAEKRIPTVGLLEVNPPSLLCFPLLSTPLKGSEGMENPGYCSGSFDGLHHPSDDDDDEMVDIAGATLDFSTTDDVPPLSTGGAAAAGLSNAWFQC